MLDRLPKRGDRAAFAKKLSVSSQDITNWAKRGIPHAKVRAVATALGMTTDQYYAEAHAAPPGGKLRTPLQPRAEVLDNLRPRPEVMDVPVYDARASMGLGAPMPQEDTVIDHLRLAGTWVRRHLPTISSTLNLAVISAYGNSMAPTFNDGDILLVDRGVTRMDVDTVYVLAFNDELYIKRIQRLPDRSLKIMSDNKTYDPIVIPAEQRDSVRVLGKVVWKWNGGTP